MSLEQNIADLTTQAGLLLDLPDAIKAEADAQIDRIADTYDSRLALLAVTCYVDPITGDDAAEGTDADPWKTIDQAVSKTPRGGLCTVNLKGPYHIDTDIPVNGIHLIVQSDGSVRHAITFEREIYSSGGDTYRRLKKFSIKNPGSLAISNLTIELPDDTGYAGNLVSPNASIIQTGTASLQGMNVKIVSCDINSPAANFGAIISQLGGPITLFTYALTITGTSLNGRWLYEFTNGAGTDPTTVPNVVTNLGLI